MIKSGRIYYATSEWFHIAVNNSAHYIFEQLGGVINRDSILMSLVPRRELDSQYKLGLGKTLLCSAL